MTCHKGLTRQANRGRRRAATRPVNEQRAHHSKVNSAAKRPEDLDTGGAQPSDPDPGGNRQVSTKREAGDRLVRFTSQEAHTRRRLEEDNSWRVDVFWTIVSGPENDRSIVSIGHEQSSHEPEPEPDRRMLR